MTTIKTNIAIYETDDYSKFKVLKGNRAVDNARVERLVKSIEEYGFLTQPILVNENMEVIDGQGRLEATKRLGVPVRFVIEHGIGMSECIALNKNSKNWTLTDYIESYAASEVDDYVWLKNQIDTYGPTLKRHITLGVAVNPVDSPRVRDGSCNDKLKSGLLRISQKERIEKEAKLRFLNEFSITANSIGGHSAYFYDAISFCYQLNVINNNRLIKVVNNARYELLASGSAESVLIQIEGLWNKGLSQKNRIDLVHLYKEACRERAYKRNSDKSNICADDNENNDVQKKEGLKYEVYSDECGFEGETYAVSEEQAINNVRFRNYGLLRSNEGFWAELIKEDDSRLEQEALKKRTYNPMLEALEREDYLEELRRKRLEKEQSNGTE